MADEPQKNELMKPTAPLPPPPPIQAPIQPRIRQLIIETDGNNVRITKSELAGSLELIAILNILLKEVSANK